MQQILPSCLGELNLGGMELSFEDSTQVHGIFLTACLVAASSQRHPSSTGTTSCLMALVYGNTHTALFCLVCLGAVGLS